MCVFVCVFLTNFAITYKCILYIYKFLIKLNKKNFEIFILMNDIEKSFTINMKRTWRAKALKPNI